MNPFTEHTPPFVPATDTPTWDWSLPEPDCGLALRPGIVEPPIGEEDTVKVEVVR